jgi:hypothetical protein
MVPGWGNCFVEKRKPTHGLEAFKRVAGNPATLDMTTTALFDARELGFSLPDVAGIIRTMNRQRPS